MGLTSSLIWKNWDMSFTLKSGLDHSVYNNIASYTSYLNHLRTDWLSNVHTSAFETSFDAMQLKSDYYVQNASFVKLTNISLGYTFDEASF